jgi:hypothetical protein
LGETPTVFHRVVASDGASETASTSHYIYITRNTLTDVEEVSLPAHFALHPAYPNPLNPQTTLRYTLPEPAHVRLAVYDVLGREVTVLAEGAMPAGTHTAIFEAGHLPAGLYVLRIQAGAFSQAQRVMLVK